MPLRRGLSARGAGLSPVLLRVADRVEEVVACAALVVVVAAVIWGVLTRYITAQPAPWSGEVAGMAFAWVVFVGAAAGFKRGAHVSIDLLTRRLPARLGQPFAWALDLGLLLFMAYVVWLGFAFTVRNWDNPSSVLRLPLSITYASVLFGFTAMTVRQAFRLLHKARPGMAAREAA